MLEAIRNEANMTLTENDALTYASTLSDCLDLFATIGALRSAKDSEITSRFVRAYTENPDYAMKMLFFARDIRGGLGERRVFRIILKWLAENEPASLARNIRHIPEYGRFDDMLSLLGTPHEKTALEVIRTQLNEDIDALGKEQAVSLLAKWLPSVNATNPETISHAKHIARFLGMDDATYRKTLSRLRRRIRIIENNLREKDYSFDYSRQPSRAMLKYRKAFLRNDAIRYVQFMEKVRSGEAKLHTGVLTPYDVVAPLLTGELTDEERRSIDTTWNALEDFASNENALAVIDGSGSMYSTMEPMPAAVALSLGIYFAERNTGMFRNHFITFSEKPQLVEIKGDDLLAKVRYCESYNEVANTNIQKVFELILKAALNHKASQEEMPSALYIISDMEFDNCAEDAGMTNFEYGKELFSNHGYRLPRVVFWNVASRNRHQPVTKNEQGVVLVSGYSSRILSMLASGTLTPYAFMMEVLTSERYKEIVA